MERWGSCTIYTANVYLVPVPRRDENEPASAIVYAKDLQSDEQPSAVHKRQRGGCVSSPNLSESVQFSSTLQPVDTVDKEKNGSTSEISYEGAIWSSVASLPGSSNIIKDHV